MKDVRVMSYFGHVIWKKYIGFCVASGDGTDVYFSTMEYIEKMEGI